MNCILQTRNGLEPAPPRFPDGQMLAAPAATMSTPSPHAIVIPRRPPEGVVRLDVAATGGIVALGLLEIVPEIDRRLIPVDRDSSRGSDARVGQAGEEWPA